MRLAVSCFALTFIICQFRFSDRFNRNESKTCSITVDFITEIISELNVMGQQYIHGNLDPPTDCSKLDQLNYRYLVSAYGIVCLAVVTG